MKTSKKINLVASGFMLKPEEIKKTKDYWIKLGIQLDNPKIKIKKRSDLLCAANLEYRVAELNKCFTNLDLQIIWALRGGYGAQEILPYLKLKKFKKDKIYIGFSDCTSIHYVLNQILGIPSIHGPHPNSFHLNLHNKKIINTYSNLLENPKVFSQEFRSLRLLNNANKKSIEGKIIGGNLTTLCSLIGTKFDKGAKNKILFLEEVQEPAYKINRLLTHLDQASFTNGVKAILLGHFSHSVKKQEALIKKVLKRWASSKSIPVLSGMQAGHKHKNNNPFWLGKKSKLILDEKPRLINNIINDV